MRGASVCGLKLRLVHASFDIRADLRGDLRGSWHALAVSVSPADGGVTVFLDGKVLAIHALFSYAGYADVC